MVCQCASLLIERCSIFFLEKIERRFPRRRCSPRGVGGRRRLRRRHQQEVPNAVPDAAAAAQGGAGRDSAVEEANHHRLLRRSRARMHPARVGAEVGRGYLLTHPVTFLIFDVSFRLLQFKLPLLAVALTAAAAAASYNAEGPHQEVRGARSFPAIKYFSPDCLFIAVHPRHGAIPPLVPVVGRPWRAELRGPGHRSAHLPAVPWPSHRRRHHGRLRVRQRGLPLSALP